MIALSDDGTQKYMKRRKFVATLLTLAFWPTVARAQRSKTAVIGILVAGNLDPRRFVSIFKDELQRLGYQEGQNVRFEFRTGEGKMDILQELAAELVQSRVDIIVTWLTPAVRAAKQATDQIPIVMPGAGDPVATGVVASLVKPGGNITGMAGLAAELSGKNTLSLSVNCCRPQNAWEFYATPSIRLRNRFLQTLSVRRLTPVSSWIPSWSTASMNWKCLFCA
jgi:ABC transporter substrate binding protein